MSPPRLLDLFCGAGGAAMGYRRAGFEVVGVDIKPQPHYPFDFVQGDALEYLFRFIEWMEDEQLGSPPFDAIHASPPCRRWAAGTAEPERHPNLISPLRELFQATGLFYVIENVPAAPLVGPVLCGQAVGLPVIRHRRFESNVFLLFPTCPHRAGATLRGEAVAFRHEGRGRKGKRAPYSGRRQWGKAAGLPEDWTENEIREAIPPAYTELIGAQLLDHLRARERAAP